MNLYEVSLQHNGECVRYAAFISESELSGRKEVMESFGFSEGIHTHVFQMVHETGGWQINIWWTPKPVVRLQSIYSNDGSLSAYRLDTTTLRQEKVMTDEQIPFRFNSIVWKLSKL